MKFLVSSFISAAVIALTTLSSTVQGQCTWEMLTETNECGIVDFCDANTPQGYGYYCGGSITGDWYVRLDRPIWCYQDHQGADDTSERWYEGLTVNPEGYCANETTRFGFTQTVLNSVDHLEMVTHPMEKMGSFRMLMEVQACENGTLTVPFSVGNVSYCEPACPTKVTVDDQDCNAQCIDCFNSTTTTTVTKQAVDCSNVHPSLVEMCTSDTSKNDFLAQVITYFEGIPTEAPTVSPVGMDETSPPVAMDNENTTVTTSEPTAAPVQGATPEPTQTMTQEPTESPVDPPSAAAASVVTVWVEAVMGIIMAALV